MSNQMLAAAEANLSYAPAGALAPAAALRALLALESHDALQKAPVPSFGPDVDTLAARIALHIGSLVRQGRARCVVLGRGDTRLLDAVRAQVPRSDWHRIEALDGERLPHADAEFDVALLCEVLHDDSEHGARLLSEAARVARCVLVKDRFEEATGSPRSARSDSVRRSRRGVFTRKRRFTRERFVQLAAQQRLLLTALDSDFGLERPKSVFMARRDTQFIAALRPGSPL